MATPAEPDKPRGRGRLFSALPYVILVAVVAGGVVTGFDQTRWNMMTGAGALVLVNLGIIATVRAARCKTLAPADRRPWWLVLAYFVSSALDTIPMSMASRQPGAWDHGSPALVVGIALGLTSVPLLLTTLLLFTSEPFSRRARYRFAMDITIVLGGGFAVMWYFLLGPVLTGPSQASGAIKAMAAAYSIADLVLALGICTVLLRGARPAVRRTLPLLIAGTGSYLVSDPILIYVSLHPNPKVVAVVTGLGVFVRATFLTSAAIEQRRTAVAAAQQLTPVAGRYRPQYWPPYLALLLGFGLLLLAAARSGWYPWGGLVVGCVIMVAGVAARQVFALRENQAMLVTDHLTGLANRIRLRAALDRATDHQRRRNVAIAVLIVDLNGFKQINDTYGHEAGDQLLVAFADVLRRSVREDDTPARLGGDEFAVLLDGIGDAGEATVIADRILARAAQPVTITGQPITIRASIGIALASADHSSTSEDLIRRADAAMYVAKRQGGSRWSLDEPAVTGTQATSSVLVTDLRHAVDAGELTLAYQPIIALISGDLVAVEALVRWQHPTLGHLPPHTFVALAEQSGTIHDIGRWVLEHACRQARTWQDRLPSGRSLHLSINLSPTELKRDSLVTDVTEILDAAGFDPHHLVLDVTEAALVDNEAVTARLDILRDLGVRIALDDFITSAVNLRHLASLPVDILKLDRCYITDVADDPQGRAVAEAVIRVAQVLNLDTVAKGIERPQQATELTLLGCRTGQGYHLAMPMSAQDFDRLIVTAVDAWPSLPASSLQTPVSQTV